MLGPDVLVAPVVTQGATSRAVYLPEGCWQLRGAGEQLRGRRTVTVPGRSGSCRT
jgi:alpha-glucosidase (family GH31 glycosyl hydrolase)